MTVEGVSMQFFASSVTLDIPNGPWHVRVYMKLNDNILLCSEPITVKMDPNSDVAEVATAALESMATSFPRGDWKLRN